mmetsp:Transcript_13143/g.27465  ORF Transcript_13143/g.27465 Transcript_13143/m.27465 type:complete len:215 (+) Transcript_13143:626-1270(+)
MPSWRPGSAAALEKASAARVSADSICSCNCEICSKCRSASSLLRCCTSCRSSCSHCWRKASRAGSKDSCVAATAVPPADSAVEASDNAACGTSSRRKSFNSASALERFCTWRNTVASSITVVSILLSLAISSVSSLARCICSVERRCASSSRCCCWLKRSVSSVRTLRRCRSHCITVHCSRRASSTMTCCSSVAFNARRSKRSNKSSRHSPQMR